MARSKKNAANDQDAEGEVHATLKRPKKKRAAAGKATIQVGDIHDVHGEVNIAGRDLYKGYTAEQVSVLLTQITSTFRPKPFDGRCPYKGLEVFEEEDAELFFGREKIVGDLLSRVRGSRAVFITGPSGSGKSSLVRAGLIPALKGGSIQDLHSERWRYETLKPGREPILELARAASSFAGTLNAGQDIRTKGLQDATVLAQWCEIALGEGREKRAVLFVDQFEEVFTQISNESERQAFLDLLTHAATVEHGRVILVFAMRSDFVSNCAAYPRLNALLNQPSAFAQIGSMQPDELVSAIAQPALRVGLRIDPDLIAQIINDMEGEPGSLPLMQFALKDLFEAEQSKGGMIALTRAAYLQRGGIHKSLERHADNAFAKLSEGERELARSIFGGLIEIGRGTQDTRRTAIFEELIPADAKDADVQATVQKLADARLITTDEQAGKDTVTISHEKLIDAWPWLKRLVNENREAIALQNEIANDAKEWEEHRRDRSYLYTGARLVNAREQLARKRLVLSGLAQEFVQASHARQRRGQLSLIAGVSALIFLSLIAVIVFSRLAGNAQRDANNAHIREILAQSMAWRERDLARSLLLGIEVFKIENSVQTQGLLLDNIQVNPQLLQFLRRHADAVTSVAFSPDGKILASGGRDHTILLWDVSTLLNTGMTNHELLGEPLSGHSGSVLSLAFSPDGKILASGSDDNTIILWDVAAQSPIGQPLPAPGPVYSLAFHPDGQVLAAGYGDNTIILWDVNVHEPIGSPLTGHSGSVFSVAFRRDGKVLASGSADRTVILWDMATHQPIGEPLAGHAGAVHSVALSPDGQTLASGGNDTWVILWDVSTLLSTSVKTHERIEPTLRGHEGRVASLAFSPDGKTLASGSLDRTVIRWDVATHERIGQPLKGHSDSLSSVAFSPDGKILASGSADRTVILWEMTASQRIDQPIRSHSGSVNSVAFSPDGKMVASGSYNGDVILRDVSTPLNAGANTGEPIGPPLKAHTDQVRIVTFSPDGQLLASGDDGGMIILWDVNTHEPIGQPLSGHAGPVKSLAFSPDGKMLASGSADKTVILWDVSTLLNTSVNTHQPIGQPLIGHSGPVNSVAFSPDGRLLASASDDKTILLWDVSTLLDTSVDTHEPMGGPLVGHTEPVRTVAFSPDGHLIASGSSDDTVILWNADTHEPIGKPLGGSRNAISSLAFRSDGGILAAGSYDKTILLFDVSTGQPVGQPLVGHEGSVLSVAYSPDGKMLASGGLDNKMILWDIDPGSWLAKSCRRAGRNLTRLEWAQYFPKEDYRKTCEQWPLEPELSPGPGPTPQAQP